MQTVNYFFCSLFQPPSRSNNKLPVPRDGHRCGVVGSRAVGQVSFMVLILGCSLAKNEEDDDGEGEGEEEKDEKT